MKQLIAGQVKGVHVLFLLRRRIRSGSHRGEWATEGYRAKFFCRFSVYCTIPSVLCYCSAVTVLSRGGTGFIGRRALARLRGCAVGLASSARRLFLFSTGSF
jgi:hypothetical protein